MSSTRLSVALDPILPTLTVILCCFDTANVSRCSGLHMGDLFSVTLNHATVQITFSSFGFAIERVSPIALPVHFAISVVAEKMGQRDWPFEDNRAVIVSSGTG